MFHGVSYDLAGAAAAILENAEEPVLAPPEHEVYISVPHWVMASLVVEQEDEAPRIVEVRRAVAIQPLTVKDVQRAFEEHPDLAATFRALAERPEC